jgi:hypothetical protein
MVYIVYTMLAFLQPIRESGAPETSPVVPAHASLVAGHSHYNTS